MDALSGSQKNEGGGGEARSEGLTQRAVFLSCPSLQEVCSAPPCGESSPSCTRSPGPGHLLVWLRLKISFIPGAHTVRIRLPVGRGIYLSRGLVMLIPQGKGKAPLNKTLQGWTKWQVILTSECGSLSKRDRVHKPGAEMSKPLMLVCVPPCRAARDPLGDPDHLDHLWVVSGLKHKLMHLLKTCVNNKVLLYSTGN